MSDYVAKVFPANVIDHGDAVHYDPENAITDAGLGYEGQAPDGLDDRFNFRADISSAWYNGSGAPSDSLGYPYDYYLNNDNHDYYQKTTGGTWISVGNMGSAGGGDVSGPGSSTDNAIARFDGTGGVTLLNSLVTLSDNGDLANVNQLQMDITPTSTVATEGTVHWNAVDQTLDVHTKWGTTLQVGQEDLVIVHNATGSEIANGTPVYPSGGATAGRPNMAPAKADVHSNFDGELLVTTDAIADGQDGPATRFGKVRDIDTSLLSLGTIWLSATVAGGYTNTKPEFPNYAVQIGGVTVSDDTVGEILLAIKGQPNDTVVNFWNGVFRESFDFRVDASGGVVTGTLSPTNGHPDMTMMFSDGLTMLDTDPGATITLTAGTATVPQSNYVYIPKSTKVLTLSTSAWPSAEHIKVAQVELLTAAITETDEGAFRNQNWNDHIEDTSLFQGHLSHIGEKLRQFEAQWSSGISGTCTIVDTSPDDVYVSCTSGVVYQMHKQAFPAQNTQTGDDVHIVNHNTTPYVAVSNLNGQTSDSTGTTLANRSFSFVFWGVQNKEGEPSHLMINLPTGSYAKNVPDQAVSDASNYSVYNIPSKFQGVGFLIARFTFTLASNGTDWILYDTEDLRGKIPNTTAGGGSGGGGVTELTGLLDTPSSYSGQGGKTLKVNSGETAVEFDDEITHVIQGNASTALSTGDGKLYFTVPASLNGYNLTAAHACVYVASSSGLPSIQIHNLTDTVDMLSTAITLDESELNSYTATTPPVVDTANDDVATGDVIRIDVDAAGTGVEGLDLHLVFNKP
jgi:hypothetical protein